MNTESFLCRCTIVQPGTLEGMGENLELQPSKEDSLLNGSLGKKKKVESKIQKTTWVVLYSSSD